MRYLKLKYGHTESSLHDLRICLKDKQFFTTGKFFLSALATISEEELEQLRPSLLPHDIALEINTDALRLPLAPLADQELFSMYTTEQDHRSHERTDIHSSMVDDDGNLTMFPTPLRTDNDGYDNVMVDSEDLQTEDVATPGPSLVQPLERDGNLPSLDLEVTPIRQDSLNRDIGRGQSHGIDNSEEHVLAVANMEHQTQHDHSATQLPASPQSHTIEIIRPEDTQPNSLVRSTQPSTTPVQDEDAESGNRPSHYLRSFGVLSSKYGENTDCDLKPAQIIEVIRSGDSFFRDNTLGLINSYVENCNGELWNTPLTWHPFNGSLTENLFKTFNCAEILEQRSVFDPLRLRVARVLLFWYCEQLCKEAPNNPELLSRCSRGRDTASVVIDLLQEEVFHCQNVQRDSADWKRSRESLMRHKKIGKRWSVFIGCIGSGFILICATELANQINNGTFTEGMIQAFLHYVINVYPEGVKTCKLLDPLSQCIITGGSLRDHFPAGTQEQFCSYSQHEEKDRSEFKEDWASVEITVDPLRAVFN